MKTYNISHISYSYSGGAGLVARRLSEYQKEALNLDSNFFFVNKSNLKENPFSDPKILLRALKDEFIIKSSRNHSPLSLERNITSTRFIKRLNTSTDLYHLHWINGALSMDAVFHKLLPKKPIVWTLHDMESFTGGCHHAFDCNQFENACSSCPIVRPTYQPKIYYQHNEKKRLIKIALNRSIAVVTPSLWLKNRAERSSVFQDFIIHKIYNPVDNIYLNSSNQKTSEDKFDFLEKNFIVGFVSSDLALPLKNFQLVKDIIRELNNLSSIEFKILAIGKNKKHKRQKDIYYAGKVNSINQMFFLYKNMDVLVVASKAESFGLSIAEAAACGVPAVVLAGSGSEELVSHNETGFIAKSQNEMYEFINKYAQNPNLVLNHGAKAHTRALKLFSEEKINNEYLKLYTDILE